jgi:Ca-activated chloride channel family protein
LETGLIAADEQGRKRAEAFVNALRPVGGTNINEALLAAMRQFQAGERPKILVFLTDGQPTVGETNINRIIDNARQTRLAGVRLFTFGVGYDVNTALLDKLAAENGGVADYIEPNEDLEVKVSNFFAKINYPVLTGLQLDLAGVETDLIYPRTMPDLFRGSQITLIGRYKNADDMDYVRVTLNGVASARARSYVYDNLRFPLRSDQNDFLPRLWATRRVGWLMEQVRINGENQELRDEIVDLGTRYGIVTPYTSYLALEQPEAAPITGAPSQPKTVGGALNSATRRPSADVAASTGVVGVQQSKKARAQQEMLRLEERKSASIRTIGGKTFYLRDGVWTDSEFKAESKLPTTTVKFSSTEYFDLLSKHPELGKYFALGEAVLVVFEGRIYRVENPTK